MKRILLVMASLCLSASSTIAQGITDRESMATRASLCKTANFYVANDIAMRRLNLLHPNYGNCGAGCQTASDIWTSSYFLNGCADCDPPGALPPASYNWLGIPYAIPGCWDPDHSPAVQEGINQGKALGYHLCHQIGNNCPAWPGCDWGLGLSCSGFVSYCWGYACYGTCTLEETDKSKELPSRDNMKKGSALISCGEPGHTVLFLEWTTPDHSSFRLAEATGQYPVVWENVRSTDGFSADYKPYDSIHVADAPGSDGYLLATRAPDGSVDLTWRVETARDTYLYEFQFRGPSGTWATLAEVEYAEPSRIEPGGARVYEVHNASEIAGEGSGLEFRVKEFDWDADTCEYGPVSASAAGAGR